MPLTDKSDAELAALVAERVMGWPEYDWCERSVDDAYPHVRLHDDGNLYIFDNSEHLDRLHGRIFDPPNCLEDAWAACERAKERGLILGFSVTDDPDGYTQAPQARVIGPGYLVYIERTDPRASGRLTIALLRACGMEEE